MDQEPRPVEIKDLNKTQLILLAILLSFVISIATGIVTVSLMQQAPTGMTQTINRVVQQTIEKVVPDYSPSKTQTVVVKEDDLVVDAVAKTRAQLGGLYNNADNSFLGYVYSLGKGTFITSSGDVENGAAYTVKLGDTTYDVKSVSDSPELGLAVLSVSNAKGDEKNLPAPEIAKDADVKPGSTLVVADADTVQKGIVQTVTPENAKDATGTITLAWNVFTIGIPLSNVPLGPVTNLDGALVGFVSENIKGAEIVGADAVMKFVANPTPAKPDDSTLVTPPDAPAIDPRAASSTN